MMAAACTNLTWRYLPAEEEQIILRTSYTEKFVVQFKHKLMLITDLVEIHGYEAAYHHSGFISRMK